MSELEIVDIRKNYGSVETLKGIDISLESGDFLVLLGASGCGKSTLLNMIAGLADPTAGDIRIEDRSVLGVAPKNRDIAMVFQSYALYPNLTVARNIGFGLEMRGVAKEERAAAVQEAARLLKIETCWTGNPVTLAPRTEIAEMTGPEVVVSGLLGEHKVVATLPPALDTPTGALLLLKVAPDALHIFDADGRRVG